MRIAKCFQIFLLMLLLACSSSGGGDSVSSQGTQHGFTSPGTATVLAFNDLGMHCIDREFSIFSILPPFNVVNAQVLFRDSGGNPVIMDDTEVELRYNSVADPAGSINTYSSGKSDFWDHAAQLFGVNLQPGEGLTGLYMPEDNPLNSGEPLME